MLYNFKPEDRQFYELLEALDIIPHLETFLANHKSRIKEAFENMLDEMKREEKKRMEHQIYPGNGLRTVYLCG